MVIFLDGFFIHSQISVVFSESNRWSEVRFCSLTIQKVKQFNLSHGIEIRPQEQTGVGKFDSQCCIIYKCLKTWDGRDFQWTTSITL